MEADEGLSGRTPRLVAPKVTCLQSGKVGSQEGKLTTKWEAGTPGNSNTADCLHTCLLLHLILPGVKSI